MDLGIAGKRAAVAAASQGLGLRHRRGARRRRRAASRSAAAIAETIEAAAAQIGAARCRSSPTCPPTTARRGFVRDARDALGGVDILVRQRRRTAARRLRVHRLDAVPRTRSS